MRQGPWTDLYALGAVVHYMLTGKAPIPSVVRAVDDSLTWLSAEAQPLPGDRAGFSRGDRLGAAGRATGPTAIGRCVSPRPRRRAGRAAAAAGQRDRRPGERSAERRGQRIGVGRDERRAGPYAGRGVAGDARRGPACRCTDHHRRNAAADARSTSDATRTVDATLTVGATATADATVATGATERTGTTAAGVRRRRLASSVGDHRLARRSGLHRDLRRVPRGASSPGTQVADTGSRRSGRVATAPRQSTIATPQALQAAMAPSDSGIAGGGRANSNATVPTAVAVASDMAAVSKSRATPPINRAASHAGRPAGSVATATHDPPPPAKVGAHDDVGPRSVCGDHNLLSRSFCVWRECSTPRFHDHAECVQLRREEEARQQKRLMQ